MAGTKLTEAQSKKLGGVVSGLEKSLKVKASDEGTKKNLARFADKYLRFKLGVRGTGPHAHGFNADQRKAITSAINSAFGIKVSERKPRSTQPATTTTKKSSSRKASSRPGTGSRKSASQLAGEQQARASA